MTIAFYLYRERYRQINIDNIFLPPDKCEIQTIWWQSMPLSYVHQHNQGEFGKMLFNRTRPHQIKLYAKKNIYTIHICNIEFIKKKYNEIRGYRSQTYQPNFRTYILNILHTRHDFYIDTFISVTSTENFEQEAGDKDASTTILSINGLVNLKFTNAPTNINK